MEWQLVSWLPESGCVYLCLFIIIVYNRKSQAQLAEVASVARLEHLLGAIAVDHNTTTTTTPSCAVFEPNILSPEPFQ